MGRKISRPTLSEPAHGGRQVRRISGIQIEDKKRRPTREIRRPTLDEMIRQGGAAQAMPSVPKAAATSGGETKTVYDPKDEPQKLYKDNEIGAGGQGKVWTLDANGKLLAVKLFDDKRERAEENKDLEKKILKMEEIFRKTEKRISKSAETSRENKKPGRRVPEPAVAGGGKPGRRILRSAATGDEDGGSFTADSGAARAQTHPYHGIKKFFRYVGVHTLTVLNYLFIKIRQFAGYVVAHAPSAYARFREVAKKINGYIVAIAHRMWFVFRYRFKKRTRVIIMFITIYIVAFVALTIIEKFLLFILN